MGRCGSVVVMAAALSALGGCGGDSGQAVVVTTELTTRWDLLPHRISFLEIAFEPDPDGRGGTMTGQNDGGPFGAVDTAIVGQSFTVYRGPALRAVPLSVTIEIPGPGTADPEDFIASADAVADGLALDGATELVAWIRGYRISTDEYATPPPFTTDPELPYDPADGFTSQGFGVQLGDPVLSAGQVTVPVTVRNSLGLADRADMNAAIPHASSWVRVDLIVVGAPDHAVATARGEVSYTLSTATYGSFTVHPRADDAVQALTVQGAPSMRSGLVGLRGFDLWVNVPGRIDPACEVVTDEINFWDEPVSGPGRYMTEGSVRLWDRAYDAATGQASARVDLYFSNSSVAKEIGNVCFGGRGDVSLLQVDAPVTETDVPTEELPLEDAGRITQSINF
jgi:hypothetical protein